jgi:hypothetical protein
MNKTSALESPSVIDELLHHIQERTFGRLHDLSIAHEPEGRISVTAIAHSRFVSQLAEWAVLERVDPDHVDLSICVRRSSKSLTPSQYKIEVQK